MDHSLFTTQKLSRRSTQPEILEAVKQCAKLLMTEYRETGQVGSTKPDDFSHAKEIALGLAATSARRVVGKDAPAFTWDKTKGAEFLWKRGELPYHFLIETHADYELRKQQHQREQQHPWTVNMDEVVEEIEAEAAALVEGEELEEGQGWEEYLASLSPEERAKVEKIEDESPRDKLRRGISERDEKRGTRVPESLSVKREIDLNDPDSWSSEDKISLGMQQHREAEGEKE